MRSPWLGQVPLARPWRREPELSGRRYQLGQSRCCVQGPPGQQQVYCFNEGCGLNWVSPPGIYPDYPQCVNGMHPDCVAAPPPPPPPPVETPPEPTPTPTYEPACSSRQWNRVGEEVLSPDGILCLQEHVCANDPSLKTTFVVTCVYPHPSPEQPVVSQEPIPTMPLQTGEIPAEVPVTPSVPPQQYTSPSAPTGAFPGDPYAPVTGAPFAPLAPSAPVQPIPVVPAPTPMPPPCPTGPIPLKEWAYGCAYAKAGLIPAAPVEAAAEGGGIPTAVLIGGGGLVAAGIAAAVFGLFG